MKACPGHRRQSLCCLETQNAPWRNAAFFGRHQAYIHSKKDTKKDVAWISCDSFESFSPLSNVWIDRPLIPSSDVITPRKPGSDFDLMIAKHLHNYA